MATRADLMQRLTTVPTEELLTLLGDEAIFELASRCLQPGISPQAMAADEPCPVEASGDDGLNHRTKRPLNAFIAFRSYYLKLFPDVQQKAASGFLTTLWNQDPFRNKWALIAKVYSFVRDEVGKDRVSLPFYLGVCCPIMNIIEPSAYLHSLGWSVETSDDGTQKLVHDQTTATNDLAQSLSQDCPTTEIDLFQALFNVGYLPAESIGLLQRLSTNTNGIMTTGSSTQAPQPSVEKSAFINMIRNDPIRATKEIFASGYDEATMRQTGYRVYDAQNLNCITHLPMALPLPQPVAYRYTHTHHHLGLGHDPIMNFSNIPEHGCYNISNPFHMDQVLGHTEPEGLRTIGHPDSPPFDQRDDFHYMF